MPGDDAPRLLLREQAELESVASKLRAGRRVVVFCVCAEALRPVTLSFLRKRSGAAIPDPAPLRSAEEALDRLTELTEQPPTVVASLAIDAGTVEVLRTLNWHREKLRRGGSSIVWLEDVEGLRALRAWAPDAYTFRDALILLRGEPLINMRTPAVETPEVLLARLQLLSARSPEERAEAAFNLTDRLMYRSAPPSEARQIAETALEEIPPDAYPSDDAKAARIGLYGALAIAKQREGQFAQAWGWAERGLAEAAQCHSQECKLRRMFLLAIRRTPFGVDHQAATQALRDLPSGEESPYPRHQVLLNAAQSAQLRGCLRQASKLLDEALATPRISPIHRAIMIRQQGWVALHRGDPSEAEERLQTASSMLAAESKPTEFETSLLVKCLHLRGELQAAKRVLEELRAYPGRDMSSQALTARELARIRLDEDSVEESLASIQGLVMEAAQQAHDADLYHASASLIGAAWQAHDADRLRDVDLQSAQTTLAMAEDVALAIAGDDPPWYSILFPALRGELLALRPDHLGEELGLLTTGVERARAAWTDAAPLHARKLIHHLVRAGHLEEARAALATALPEAEAQENLKELAALQASNVVVLARTGAASAEITSALDRLRATFEANGGRLLPAETLLELARALPPDASHPDPLQLLDEAHAHFLEMPMPAQEARCLEAMGDVLAARGQTSDARRRYLLAKGIYEQYGLGLRLPLLASKLSRLPPPQAS